MTVHGSAGRPAGDLATEQDAEDPGTQPVTETCYCERCRPLVTARYDGACCRSCGHRVLQGDEITTRDGETWVHLECAVTCDLQERES